MKNVYVLLFALITMTMNAQEQELPYAEIGPYQDEFTAHTVLSRMVEGLGYRFYWATESLTENDLSYKPSESGRSSMHAIEHIYGLTEMVIHAFEGKQYDFSQDPMTFEELRSGTLMNLKKMQEMLAENPDFANMPIKFNYNGQDMVFPFWHAINGPLSDALWHTGQVVMLRRASGNPLPQGVNVFTGKTMM